ncbi:MAG TPA: S8 family serine peptidase [Solirubrobacteraceae bacterium]|nr:S8 family serine peptidase [Solirubrobacteraceae bacterium]
MDFNGAFQPSDETTGRSLVLFEEDGAEAGMQAVQEAVGVEMVAATGEEAAPAAGGGILFESLGVAVVDAPPEQVMQAAGDPAIIAVEAERIVHALEATGYAPPAGNGHAVLPHSAAPVLPVAQAPQDGGHSGDYLRGYREAVLHLTDAVAGEQAGAAEALAAAVDESQATWGLQVTKVVNCCRSGEGIRVAVLDTGFDLQHPDFAGRSITTQSFIAGEAVQDGHGHGTHCIGTALGAKCPGVRPRYGIAYEAEIYAGKVLSNAGSGSDTGILAGIEWAVQNKCAVISMSLGAATRPGQTFSRVFERVALRAQGRGTLIVAAAGNESRRPGIVNPVGHPANCPSIMAVAAMDVQGAIARFSNRGINPDGGQIDIAGPGVDVHSSWPVPTRYRRISGTSMATPHVAGIAALYAAADPSARGAALGRALTSGAQRLTLPSSDVGAGMVQAP